MAEYELTGILGGSFNPVHMGHFMLASYLVEFTPLDSVWLMLSPLNPLKPHPEELIADMQRLRMLEIAARSNPRLSVCDIELSMPRPSYTADTLQVLARRYPRRRFKLVIGSDNWKIFNSWRRHEEILDNYGVIVYPRPGYDTGTIYDDRVEVVNAPMVELSSSWVRRTLARGKDLSFFLPPGVYDYIKANNLYRQ